MTWSGGTVRAEAGLPSSFPEQPGWHRAGRCHTNVCSWASPQELTHTPTAALWAHPSPPETLKMKRHGATQLTSGPSNPGTSSSPSSSGSRNMLHSGNMTHDTTCLRNQLFRVKPKEQTA